MNPLTHLFAPKPAPQPAPIVIVSGLPRSGTSMMMKMLEAGGIPPITDNLRRADDDNPEGYYEFERVKELPKGDVAWLPEARGKTVKVISELLLHLPAGHRYDVIFMVREMEEVLASQRKMLTNRQVENSVADDAAMTALYQQHLREVNHWLDHHAGAYTLKINYNRLLKDPRAMAARINEFLGGALDVERMVEVVNPALYRQRKAG